MQPPQRLEPRRRARVSESAPSCVGCHGVLPQQLPTARLLRHVRRRASAAPQAAPGSQSAPAPPQGLAGPLGPRAQARVSFVVSASATAACFLELTSSWGAA
eukprot:1440744-Rhodomonas_salina.2